MAIWKPSDGYFGNLLTALRGGGATYRTEGDQNTGGGSAHGTGRPITADTALRISSVWACVQLCAEIVGSMPIRVLNLEPDGVKTPNPDHWLNGLFERPNPYQTRNEFFETLVMQLMLAGNSFNVIGRSIRAGGEIVSLMPMMATQTEVKWSRGSNRTYAFTDGTDVAAFGQDRVWHTMLMPSTAVVGLSPIQYGARTMGIAMGSDERVGTLAANGFKPTGVLMLDKALKDDQRKAIRKEFADLQSGQGDPLKVLEAGMKYQQISISPKDAQLIEARQFSVEDIARIFGVPSVLINDTSGTTAWGTGIGEIKQGFYVFKIRPLLERIEASISRWLIPVADRGNIIVEFDFGAFLRGDDAARVTTQAAAVAGNLLTINEARAIEGRPPVPGGDEMLAQSQMVPITMRTEEPSDDNPQFAED